MAFINKSHLYSLQVLPCSLKINTDPLFARLKPVEQLSPMPSPSDCETKFERKKSQPSHVGTQRHSKSLYKSDTFLQLSQQNKCPFCSFFFSYQRRTLSITSCSRRSAKMRYSNRVSFRPSLHMKASDCEIVDLDVKDSLCRQVTLVPCRETFCIRAKCSSLITGSVSTPKSLAEIPR